jgi:hypothetical protein
MIRSTGAKFPPEYSDGNLIVNIHSFIVWARQQTPRIYLGLGLIVQPLSVHSAQIQQPCAFYEEVKVSYRGCAHFFCFDKQIHKNVVALTSQCLAAANNMLHCFYLLPAESAGWIPIKQAHSEDTVCETDGTQ